MRTVEPTSIAPLGDAPGGAQVGSTTSWKVARTLGRIEGRKLLSHPAVVAGIAFTALLGSAFGADEVTDQTEDAFLSGFAFLVLAAATLVAANLAVLRGRRHRTEELFSATPSDPAARTGAHLLALAGLLVVSLALLVAGVLLSAMTTEGFGRPHPAELAVGPLLVAGAGALGVFLARWAPFRLTVPLALVAIAFFELWLNSETWVVSSWRWVVFWYSEGALPASFLPPRPSAWHLLYLVGLVALAGVGALLAHGWRRRVVVPGIVVAAVVAASTWAQTRPPSPGEWAARNNLLANPQDHQSCESREGVTYCAYPHYQALVDFWQRPIAGVAARLPAGALHGLEVSQRLSAIDLQYVTDGHRRKLEAVLPDLPAAQAPPPDDGDLHPPVLWTTSGAAELGLALGAAAHAVGLPLVPAAGGTRCDGAGQGRAVAALWLAGQATTETEAALRRLAPVWMRSLAGGEGRHLVVRDLTDWGAHESGVAWGETEVAAALALLDRPVGEVASVLVDDWEQLTDPPTSTEEVMARFRLAPGAVGPPERDDDVKVAVLDIGLGGPC